MNIVSFTTPAKNFQIYKFNSDAAAYTIASRQITTTKPTNGNGSFIVGSPPNYMKIRMALGEPYDPVGNGVEIYLVGWNFCADNMSYIPQVLYYSPDSTQSSSIYASNIPEGPWYEVDKFEVPLQGDAKIFNAITGSLTGSAATLVVDTMGCEFVEIYVNCGTTVGVRPVYLAVSGF
jgi:hypothetical protein